jgi:hypothetical protein
VTAEGAEIRGQRLAADARESGPVRPRIIGRNDFGQADVGGGVLDGRKREFVPSAQPCGSTGEGEVLIAVVGLQTRDGAIAGL